VLTVQFDHRMIAYAIFAIAWLHVLGVNREADPGLKRTALLLALAISLQAIIGIVTLLHQAPLPLALAHQGIAMVVLTIATIHAHRAIQSKTGALVGAPAASTAV
jgi:cytochrome c oxidase assembly protein subunit 15